QALREVAQELAAPRVDLLRVETEVVGVGKDLLHRLAGLVDAAEPRERLDQPERARRECALLAHVLARAIDEAGAGCEPLPNRVHGAAEALRLGVAHAAGPEHARVERLLAGPAAVRPELVRPAVPLDPGVKTLVLLAPLRHVAV